MHLPNGTVTFLFTDIEGGTKLAQEHPDDMPALLRRHCECQGQGRNGSMAGNFSEVELLVGNQCPSIKTISIRIL